jgi:hypothetical protein
MHRRTLPFPGTVAKDFLRGAGGPGPSSPSVMRPDLSKHHSRHNGFKGTNKILTKPYPSPTGLSNEAGAGPDNIFGRCLPPVFLVGFDEVAPDFRPAWRGAAADEPDACRAKPALFPDSSPELLQQPCIITVPDPCENYRDWPPPAVFWQARAPGRPYSAFIREFWSFGGFPRGQCSVSRTEPHMCIQAT